MAAGGGQEPNLTPFIDLFSVLVCFLLMTAAWLQLESLQTNIESATSSESAPSESKPPDDKKANLSIVLKVTETVLNENEVATVVPKMSNKINKDKIIQTLKTWKLKYPDRKDVIVNSESGVFYGELIGVYDLLISTGWPDVGINPN